MENKLLTEIKDEYAREKKYNDWNHFYFTVYGWEQSRSIIDKATNEIATRYAAKENEGLRDVRELTEQLQIAIDLLKPHGYTTGTGTWIGDMQKAIGRAQRTINQNTDV